MKNLAKKLIAVFSALLFIVLPLTACSSNWQIIESSNFNTSVYIAVKGKPVKEKKRILDLLTYLEESLSVKSQTSCVKELNDADADTPVETTDECMELFTLAKKYYDLTNGKFNIAVRPAAMLFKLSSDTFNENPPENFPSEEDIENLKPIIDLNNFTADYENKTLSKKNAEAQIDLGGIAKGYATDKVYRILSDAGYTEGYISIGSSSLYILNIQDGLKIAHPRKKESYIIKIDKSLIQNEPVSTSGDYVKYYVDKNTNKRYCHVMDGTTAKPISTNIVSVTAIGVSAAFTDALTTALCCMEHDPARKDNSQIITYAQALFEQEEYKNLSIFAVYDDGTYKQILTNKKQGKDFTLLDADYEIVEF